MKKLIAALALITAGYAATTQAGDVGVSISIGQPGFYGQLDLGRVGPPQVVYPQPVVIERGYWNPAPVYVRAPEYQYSNWRRYCGQYNACSRPVYFVRDDWYRNVYAPQYHRVHPNVQPYAYQQYGRDRGGDGNYNRNYDRDQARNQERFQDRKYERNNDQRDDRDHGRDYDHDRR
jgi:hypothetical protein